jgi:hypothetical protein
MKPQEYLNAIKTRVNSSKMIFFTRIIKEKVTTKDGYIRIKFVLNNGQFLELMEYFVLERDRCITDTYRYEWIDESQKVLIKRWDNVEHLPELANFPHHLHVGMGKSVKPSRTLSIIEVIELIEKELKI